MGKETEMTALYKEPKTDNKSNLRFQTNNLHLHRYDHLTDGSAFADNY
jgi:hypothetical protein